MRAPPHTTFIPLRLLRLVLWITGSPRVCRLRCARRAARAPVYVTRNYRAGSTLRTDVGYAPHFTDYGSGYCRLRTLVCPQVTHGPRWLRTHIRARLRLDGWFDCLQFCGCGTCTRLCMHVQLHSSGYAVAFGLRDWFERCRFGGYWTRTHPHVGYPHPHALVTVTVGCGAFFAFTFGCCTLRTRIRLHAGCSTVYVVAVTFGWLPPRTLRFPVALRLRFYTFTLRTFRFRTLRIYALITFTALRTHVCGHTRVVTRFHAHVTPRVAHVSSRIG